MPSSGELAARLDAAARSLDKREGLRLGAVVLLLVFLLTMLPSLLSLYYVDAFLEAAVYAIVALGLSLLVGRVGIVSLGQVAVLALGAWVAARLLFATSLPFPLVLLASGLITMALGTLVGLPALRMGGIYLALITLMMAGAITVVLNVTNFPNGGHGFLGYNGLVTQIPAIRRPAIANGDRAYFRYTVVVAALMFGLVVAHLRGRPGRAWAALRQSESAALATGINTTFYKLWALALASFVTGVAGGLDAGDARFLYATNFQPQASITLLAIVLMGGVYTLWGALVAGILLEVLPAVMQNLGVSVDVLTVLFGIGVLQALTTAPGGLTDQLPKDLRRLARFILRHARRPATAGGT